MSWLGILDVHAALAEAVELAPLAERTGYTRYWVAEHQPQPSPISLAFLVAGQTEKIRIGTAGVLLHYYPPLRTAHEFHLLETTFPGRVDAGFCGGKMAPHLVEIDREGRDIAAIERAFPERAAQLVRHLRNTRADPAFDSQLAWDGVTENPPQIWWHGSSHRSASAAAEAGVAFGYALQFANSVDSPDVLRRYRDAFVPYRGSQALAILAVAGVCAETEAEARALADRRPSKFFEPRVVGSPQTCLEHLGALRERYAADEVIFADLCHAFAPRVRCYELLAEAAGLQRV